MLTNADFSTREQTPEELAVRQALVAYKMALINAHYRNWLHRFSCWVGDQTAKKAEEVLRQTEAAAKTTINLSGEHQRLARWITMQQPESVRERDGFLALIV